MNRDKVRLDKTWIDISSKPIDSKGILTQPIHTTGNTVLFCLARRNCFSAFFGFN